jgi:Ion transport protein
MATSFAAAVSPGGYPTRAIVAIFPDAILAGWTIRDEETRPEDLLGGSARLLSLAHIRVRHRRSHCCERRAARRQNRSFARGVLEGLDSLIVLVFVTEISLKILTLKRAFWQDPWNWFDLEVVTISLAPANDAFASRRALRLLQLVAVLPSLRRAVEGFLKATPSLSSIMLLLLFIFSDMGSKVFGEQHPEAFGSLGVSVFSLFAVMTLEGWPDLARGHAEPPDGLVVVHLLYRSVELGRAQPSHRRGGRFHAVLDARAG